MIVKVITIISVLYVSANCNALDHEPKYAVSSQSYHREDVPLSYNYRSVHIYTTPKPEQRQQYLQHEKPIYHRIQYAPLKQNNYISDDKNLIQSTPEQYSEIVTGQTEDSRLNQEIYVTERNLLKHDLEPREEAVAPDQRYRSFVSGHNIEIVQPKRPYAQKTLHNNFENQQVTVPKFAFYQKPETQIHTTATNLEIPPKKTLSEGHNILYTIIREHGPNTNINAYKNAKPQRLRQAFSPKTPRLHLNIARVYGIAHLEQQGLGNRIRGHQTKQKTEYPAYTQAFFLPLEPPPVEQKTILYPVQDRNKNFPVDIS